MEEIIRLTPQTVQADLDALGQYKGPGSLPDPNIYYRTERNSAPKLVRSWWGKVDSNHRSDKQQIYSLSPLATREIPHMYLELVDGFEPPTC